MQVTYWGSITIRHHCITFRHLGNLVFYHPCLNLFSDACSKCLHHLYVIFQVLNKDIKFDSYTFLALEEVVSAVACNPHFSVPDSNSGSWQVKQKIVLEYCQIIKNLTHFLLDYLTAQVHINSLPSNVESSMDISSCSHPHLRNIWNDWLKL